MIKIPFYVTLEEFDSLAVCTAYAQEFADAKTYADERRMANDNIVNAQIALKRQAQLNNAQLKAATK